MEQLQNDLIDRRYVVGWTPIEARTLVFVYDKLSHRLVYQVNTSDRKKTYPYIRNFYGESNCIPPKQLDVRFFVS